ncbi:hypothetical protein [uncultured Roseobacter sp.]|uniref:ImuA family protein n=1 Tax=uncultured Roseobacter sp. TaxID=114847 RepID=UPI0026140D93|nr:hypothetical protein [uncultured Roseobacter sp.]
MSAHLSIKRLKGQARPRVQQVSLSEVFPQTVSDAGAIGFVLSRLPKTSAPVLWVQDHVSCKEAGRPYLPGIREQSQLIWVTVSRPADVLWAMEEGLRCHALSAVIGEVWGAPPAVSFTATKRLALRAEAAGVACWLIRRAAEPGLSAARERWRVGSLPSAAHAHDPQAPGAPRWQAELFKSRMRKPGTWALTHDRAADRVHILAPVRDGAVAESDGARRKRAL